MRQKSVYSQLVEITQEYLGPPAERLVYGLVDEHLHIDPAELMPKDIPELIQWIKASLGLLTNDKFLIDECEQKILRLADVYERS
jgi:hypothetical protein